VEDEIYKHPKVKEVAVVGVPDSYRGINRMLSLNSFFDTIFLFEFNV
jgi:acyl-coenzyme A synthetase/AMP-(fatty) acid ligase